VAQRRLTLRFGEPGNMAENQVENKAKFWEAFRTNPSKESDHYDRSVIGTRTCLCYGLCEGKEKTEQRYVYSQFHNWMGGLRFDEKYGYTLAPTEEELAKRVNVDYWDYFECVECHSISGEGPNDANRTSIKHLEERTWKSFSTQVY